MTPLTLVDKDHPVLRQVATPIQKITNTHRRTARAMSDFLYDSANGVGLAANQIGIAKRMIAIRAGEKPGMIMVNPEITWTSEETHTMKEGCLTLPGIQVEITRPAKIKVTGQYINGQVFSLDLDGMLATIVQHEIDHLNGKLITDYQETT